MARRCASPSCRRPCCPSRPSATPVLSAWWQPWSTSFTMRGHQVTLFAPADSVTQVELVPTVEQSLWSRQYRGDLGSYMNLTLAKVWERRAGFDIIHSHVETLGFLFARLCPTPVVTTLHGRLDHSGMPELLEEFRDIPLVAISESQRRWSPQANWVATIHHGLPLDRLPFLEGHGSYLAFVGRVTPEKGVAEAIELARRTNIPLRMAAKVYDLLEREYFARGRPARHRRGHRHLPWRVGATRAGCPLRGSHGHRHAGRLARALRTGGHRVDGHRDARHRPPRRRPHGDDRAPRNGLPGRRSDGGGAGRPAGGGALARRTCDDTSSTASCQGAWSTRTRPSTAGSSQAGSMTERRSGAAIRALPVSTLASVGGRA